MNRRIVSICFIAAALVTATIWTTAKVRSTGREISRVNLPKRGIDSARALTTAELVQQSQVIATGRCLETHSSWIGKTLYTIATIQVNETLKGQSAETLTVAIPGGVDMNRKIPVAMQVPGAPEFHAQEEVFLFLSPATNVPGLAVTGFAAGKFSIVDDGEGNKLVSYVSVIAKRGANSNAGSKHSLKLDEFKENVKHQLERQ